MNDFSINPFANRRKVAGIFNSIASFYEPMNKIMSFGLDGIWRDKAKGYAYGTTLDVACGTGEMTSRFSCSHNVHKVIGTDISIKMMKWGMKNKKFCKDVNFVLSAVEFLPFKSEAFDCVSISFAIRNFEDRIKAIDEIRRVLKKGGRFIILDTLRPRMNPVLYFFYKLYLLRVIPFFIGLLTGDRNSYLYMSQSILNFYSVDEFSKILKQKGFEIEKIDSITFGVVNLIVSRKV
ncbi:MAG: ubiquinone/menaquinone biosynthesis methyltransferase [Candidatus Calescibacterium sp.]|nr:ubiquinone/menaquinone biosynthesis methyltransferase [Candidatus Calescibacterium sp.]MCX7733691.1 ubiquinone/menaquinone biosynthesis methyltransferase [bacterium]MDW8087972.1 ubiquinone/menaquinone biosynthesis methyltransferase [Candidatus Calescibacterium sp.]